ncbi:NADH/ubiquinone/plastoquinone (complex I) [bacterium]|nr:NADH/ubiquinone/plastoquinone (complex I) [bacterium]
MQIAFLAAGGVAHESARLVPNASDLPALILVPLIVGVFLVPLLGLLRRRLAYVTTLLILATYAALALTGLRTVLDGSAIHYRMAGWTPPLGIELALDPLSAFVMVTIAVIGLLVTIYAGAAVRRETPEREVAFFALMVVMLLGLSGMVMTADLFNLYVFFEVSSLSGYALMAVGHRKAVVSAYRYLLLGTIGASFYLLGVGFLYVLTGSLNMADVAARLGDLAGNPALSVSLVFMVLGLGLKMALFPLHIWLPDAYTYASSTSTAIIAPVMTKVSAYVLIRMLYFVYGADWSLSELGVGPVVAWLAMGGVVWGSVMALAQQDAKRMLAYSSVAQVGYIGLGLATGHPLALTGAILHILNHAMMKSTLFLVTGSVELSGGSRRLGDWKGLGRRMPLTFVGFTLAALAMVGIPPTSGFFSKWYLALGLADSGQWALLVLLILSGLLTAGYFFRVLERVYAREPREGAVQPAGEATAAMNLPVIALGAGTLLLGLFNAWFVGRVIAQALPAGLNLPGVS